MIMKLRNQPYAPKWEQEQRERKAKNAEGGKGKQGKVIPVTGRGGP
jgi:hypothetical protein